MKFKGIEPRWCPVCGKEMILRELAFFSNASDCILQKIYFFLYINCILVQIAPLFNFRYNKSIASETYTPKNREKAPSK
jgi:hypothetical protein